MSCWALGGAQSSHRIRPTPAPAGIPCRACSKIFFRRITRQTFPSCDSVAIAHLTLTYDTDILHCCGLLPPCLSLATCIADYYYYPFHRTARPSSMPRASVPVMPAPAACPNPIDVQHSQFKPNSRSGMCTAAPRHARAAHGQRAARTQQLRGRVRGIVTSHAALGCSVHDDDELHGVEAKLSHAHHTYTTHAHHPCNCCGTARQASFPANPSCQRCLQTSRHWSA